MEKNKNTENIEKNGQPTPSEIDASLEELSKNLAKIKKERLDVEKREKILYQRNKILLEEKNKVKNQLDQNVKSQKSFEKIRVNMQKHKDLMNDKKKTDEKNLELQKGKNSEIKKKISNTLKNWKSNLTSKNKKEAEKAKDERAYHESEINKDKEKFEGTNKGKHDRVLTAHIQKEEQRKNEEYKKKLELLEKLKETIKKEKELKGSLEGKISEHNKKNEEILGDINNYNSNIKNNEKKWCLVTEKSKRRCKTPKGVKVEKLNTKK